MRIPDHIKQQILDAARIEDVVRAYGIDLKHQSGKYVGRCPFHSDKHPSFTVTVRGRFANRYKCWPCNKSGDAVNFIQEMDHCDFPTALRKLAELVHLAHLLP